MSTLALILGLLFVAAVVLCAGLVWDRLRLLALQAEATASRDAAEARTGELEMSLNQATQQNAELDKRLDELTLESATLAERLESAKREHAARMDTIESERRAHAEREEKRLSELNQAYQEKLEALASKALQASNEQFLKLAGETFQRHQQKADSLLDEKQKAISELVKPIAETLKKTDEKLTQLDKSRAESQSALEKHLGLLTTSAQTLESQTRKLVQSLKAPQVRGRWGEMALRNAVELAGMTEHCDFGTQSSVATEDGALRPDMTINLPGDRVIVVDAKAPLHAYLEAIEADTEDQRADRLKAHARQLRKRIDDLAAKNYHAQFDNTLDFVVLFVPGDQFLSAALLQDPGLLEHAANRSILLTTPGSIIALLKAVAFGWSQASLADDAREILQLGRQLHERVAVMADHLGKLGTHLSRSVDAFNRTMSSYESRVLPAGRKMEEHNLRSPKELPSGDQVTIEPRLPPADEEAKVTTRKTTPRKRAAKKTTTKRDDA